MVDLYGLEALGFFRDIFMRSPTTPLPLYYTARNFLPEMMVFWGELGLIKVIKEELLGGSYRGVSREPMIDRAVKPYAGIERNFYGCKLGLGLFQVFHLTVHKHEAPIIDCDLGCCNW